MIRVFIRGMVEFRRSFTPHYANPRANEWYDHGRDLAHRLTMRRFDQ